MTTSIQKLGTKRVMLAMDDGNGPDISYVEVGEHFIVERFGEPTVLMNASELLKAIAALGFHKAKQQK